MPRTIFWSWQSDTPHRETRDVIHEALKKAVIQLSAELEEAARVEVDQGAQGVVGMEIIAEEILRKIESAFAFVCDITSVAKISHADFDKYIPNPNVMLELGYARCALGPKRLIPVFNSAFGPGRHEHLPFDLRHMSGCIKFDLPEDAPTEHFRRARDTLQRQFFDRLSAMIKLDDTSTPSKLAWREPSPTVPSMWNDGSPTLAVNARYGGRVDLALAPAPHIYVRLMPSEFVGVTDPHTNNPAGLDQLLRPIVCGNSLQGGSASLGKVCYSPIDNGTATKSIARWYRDNGELWAISSWGFYPREGATLSIAHDEIITDLLEWLPLAVRCVRAAGGKGPIAIKVGAFGLDKVMWWRPYSDGNAALGLDEHVSAEGILLDDNIEPIQQLLLNFSNSITDSFGKDPLTRKEILAL